MTCSVIKLGICQLILVLVLDTSSTPVKTTKSKLGEAGGITPFSEGRIRTIRITGSFWYGVFRGKVETWKTKRNRVFGLKIYIFGNELVARSSHVRITRLFETYKCSILFCFLSYFYLCHRNFRTFLLYRKIVFNFLNVKTNILHFYNFYLNFQTIQED